MRTGSLPSEYCEKRSSVTVVLNHETFESTKTSSTDFTHNDENEDESNGLSKQALGDTIAAVARFVFVEFGSSARGVCRKLGKRASVSFSIGDSFRLRYAIVG